jgi:ribosomal protein S18 acetylase RimI-like enzyme
MLELIKMTKEEFDKFLMTSKANYRQDKIRANSLSDEDAEKIANDDFDRFLPAGYLSKDNFLNMILDSGKNPVGYLWYLIRGAENNKKAFIADILIYKEYRGKGFGRETMLLLEERVKEQGLSSIGLHVFGFNETATKLYNSLNYQVTDLVMEKKLL